MYLCLHTHTEQAPPQYNRGEVCAQNKNGLGSRLRLGWVGIGRE